MNSNIQKHIKRPDSMKMKSATMVYKCPGQHKKRGTSFDYLIVEKMDLEATLKLGWFESSDAAREAYQAKKASEAVKVEEKQASSPIVAVKR